MAYDKHTWITGETITASKLNHIEDGIVECCSSCDTLIVTLTSGGDYQFGTADATFGEIYTAYKSGRHIRIQWSDTVYGNYEEMNGDVVGYTIHNEANQWYGSVVFGAEYALTTDSYATREAMMDDYPVL